MTFWTDDPTTEGRHLAWINQDGNVRHVHESARPSKRENLYAVLAMLAFCGAILLLFAWGCVR